MANEEENLSTKPVIEMMEANDKLTLIACLLGELVEASDADTDLDYRKALEEIQELSEERQRHWTKEMKKLKEQGGRSDLPDLSSLGL